MNCETSEGPSSTLPNVFLFPGLLPEDVLVRGRDIFHACTAGLPGAVRHFLREDPEAVHRRTVFGCMAVVESLLGVEESGWGQVVGEHFCWFAA